MSSRACLPHRWNRARSKLLFLCTDGLAGGTNESSAVSSRPTLAALRGRITEISGPQPAAAFSLAVRWVVEAQRMGEIAVWLQPPAGQLYPPDLAEAGVELAQLVVVRVPDGHACARAAELLLRSGGVSLAVLDLVSSRPRRRGWLNRLSSLALAHQAALVCLTTTPAEQPSLASLVSLRLDPQLVRKRGPGFTLVTSVRKDKRGMPHRTFEEELRGPLGLR